MRTNLYKDPVQINEPENRLCKTRGNEKRMEEISEIMQKQNKWQGPWKKHEIQSNGK